jgi:Ca2+/Na+ antiporter
MTSGVFLIYMGSTVVLKPRNKILGSLIFRAAIVLGVFFCGYESKARQKVYRR